MRALLDANVIIALLDSDHAFHERGHDWGAEKMKRGWASCPLTENGVVRIMSNPNYSQKTRFTPADMIGRLRTFAPLRINRGACSGQGPNHAADVRVFRLLHCARSPRCLTAQLPRSEFAQIWVAIWVTRKLPARTARISTT